MMYAGIGARDTPEDVCSYMTQLATFFRAKGYTLRSGRARRGADLAFERGAGLQSIIYTPEDADNNPHWFEHAAKYHPAWNKCKPDARRIHARNSPIILGPDLNSPVDFVVCWTADGTARGGTGQGMRIAQANNIPIFNLYFPDAAYKLAVFYGKL